MKPKKAAPEGRDVLEAYREATKAAAFGYYLRTGDETVLRAAVFAAPSLGIPAFKEAK